MADQATQMAKAGAAAKPQAAPAGREKTFVVGDHETQVLRGEDALHLLCNQSHDLDSFSACPMQSRAWREACAQSFTDGEPRVITLRRGGRIVAVAALTQARRQRKLQGLGHELFEPNGFAYTDSASCLALAHALVELRQPIFLRDVDGGSLLVESLQEACEGRRICIVRPMPAHPWLPLDESWRAPEQHLNPRRRSDLRRARRTAETFGPVKFSTEMPDLHSLDALLDRVFQVEASNWKGQQGSAMLRTPAIQEFYRRFARSACRQGILRVITLTLGEKMAAAHMGVVFNSRFWLLKMGYDENYARCSPGLLLMVESLRYAAERGLEAFEMMGEEEPWNRVWTDQSHPSVSIRIYGPGLPGLCNVAADVAGAAQRKAAAWIKTTARKKLP